MAKIKNQNKIIEKEKPKEKEKSSIHTASSNTVHGGRGGSFAGKSTKPSVSNDLLAFPTGASLSVAETFQKADTAKKLAQAQRGLASYTEDKSEKQDKHSSDALMYASQAPSDAPGIVHSFYTAKDAYARDDSYKSINPDWSFQEKLNFGYLYDSSPKAAESYAIRVNNDLALMKTQDSRKHIRDTSSRDVFSGMVHTAGALGVSALLPMGEFLDRAAQFSARGFTTEKDYITPWDYSQEVQAGIRDKLNGVDETGIAHKVLDEEIPILGGKGLGDLYQIGFGVAENWLSANTVGRAFATGGKLASQAAMMANGFARTATATIDSARRSGANGKQSMALGLTTGLLEAAADLLPLDDLLRITPATSVKELLPTILKHSALEGLTEAVTEGLGQVAEYRILGDFSTYSQRQRSYLQQGFTPEEAARKALRDSINDLSFTMLAATASGALSAGTQSALESSLAALRSAEADIKANTYSIADVFQTRKERNLLSASAERFSPEGQKQLSRLEARLHDLQTKYENNVKATQARDAHLEAIRRELSSPDHQPPFSPELYRFALETATPNGWDTAPRNTDRIAVAAKGEFSSDLLETELSPEFEDISEAGIEKSIPNTYNESEKSSYRLRFMSNRDQFYRNLERVDLLPGYQDIACHADAYGFDAHDPETGELYQEISPKELAYRIMDSGKYNGGPIRLLACSAGALPDGAAQQLADLLKVPVLAPTNTLFTSQDGYVAVASNDTEAIRMMSRMSKNSLKFSMEGWKLYEPRER